MDWIERQRAFQQRYRQGVSPAYRGPWHAAAVALFGSGVMALALVQLESVSGWQWWTVAVALLVANVLEYVAHRWLGHRRTRILPLFYQRHSGDHHRFFTHQDLLCRDSRDWRVVLFPPYLILVISLGNALVALGLGRWLGANSGWLWLATTVAAYLWYEVSHFCWHLPATHRLFRIGFFASMRERHRLHHHPKRMNRINFNITWPFTDWLLGTGSLSPSKDDDHCGPSS
ncbi:Fatty acid hydroxylase superfamily protein [Ferrimonas sediminum]|uniref:Fatty acid hydroxylase superfamily protein n=1 Tax=Ferrimonas sediminum TaxID=718193 RepID=A0A1G8NKZ1_9GAMM|nr:sterol desaturase family protein [Ferrimonas sediminum]SDI80874.1 Fatty acid hydroxylase superfamily protein [Ferrimonas sediminum]